MGKIAFVFSGQGDQYPGMGKELYEKYPVARKIYDLCDEIRPVTSSQCFWGTEEELKETRNTQPCMFVMELAAAGVLMKKKIIPDVVAGFSLGEVAAATISGIFDTKIGFYLVCKRGELMQQEAEKFDTSMAAVVRLTKEQVQELCEHYKNIYPVNFNCPGQITVAGIASEMNDFSAEVKAVGGRALPLKVKGAFHSSFMNQAAGRFAQELEMAEKKIQKIPIYSNVTAELYDENVIQLLSDQICSPVQWEKLVNNIIRDGVDTFIEIGPGKTLTNMIRKINENVHAISFMDYLAEVEQC